MSSSAALYVASHSVASTARRILTVFDDDDTTAFSRRAFPAGRTPEKSFKPWPDDSDHGPERRTYGGLGGRSTTVLGVTYVTICNMML